MTARLRSVFEGTTLVLTLHNPELRNALGTEMYAAGVEALSAAESNPDVRCVVIAGEGGIFSAGANLLRILGNRQKPLEAQLENLESLNSWIEAICTFPKPVLAAVEGAAVGAGFSLALACDMIVAARNAVFVMAGSNVALSPSGGASWSLARKLPRQLVSEILMLGERVSAERMHAMGVVNQLTDAGVALDGALALAERLAARSSNVIASIKELIAEAPNHSLNQHMALERNLYVRNLQHPNAGIGIEAFLARRTPRFE